MRQADRQTDRQRRRETDKGELREMMAACIGKHCHLLCSTLTSSKPLFNIELCVFSHLPFHCIHEGSLYLHLDMCSSISQSLWSSSHRFYRPAADIQKKFLQSSPRFENSSIICVNFFFGNSFFSRGFGMGIRRQPF